MGLEVYVQESCKIFYAPVQKSTESVGKRALQAATAVGQDVLDEIKFQRVNKITRK